MPFIDVSDVLLDPDFEQEFLLLRSVQTVDDGGIATNTPTQLSIAGVIVPKTSELDQVEEGLRIVSMIEVFTPFLMTAGSAGIVADIVVYNNRSYRVMAVEDWSAYGNGWTKATCTEMSLANTAGVPVL
jgi:galactose-6-phosphate isomerase